MDKLPLSRVSERLAKPSSDVWAVHYAALARREAGEDVTLLSVGDPDFDTPQYISDRVVERIRSGRTHYSPAAGEPELRAAVAKLESESTGYAIDPAQIVIFPGATATLFAVMSCILNEGDGLVLAEPLYVGYQGILESIGIDRQPFELSQPDFEVRVDDVLDTIDTNTRAVLLNTPGNPCGNMISRETLTELARHLRDRDIWLICDEVYSLITFDDRHVSLLNCVDDLSNIIVIDGLSKSHAMSGWRVGWAVASEAMAGTLTRFSGAALFGVSQFVQDAAAFALETDAEEVEKMRQAYRDRRNYVVSRVRQIPELALSSPRGGMFAMIDVGGTGLSGEQFSRRLLDDHGVAVLPGTCFGSSTASYVRLSLTEDQSVLGAAFDRIAELCAGLDVER